MPAERNTEGTLRNGTQVAVPQGRTILRVHRCGPEQDKVVVLGRGRCNATVLGPFRRQIVRGLSAHRRRGLKNAAGITDFTCVVGALSLATNYAIARTGSAGTTRENCAKQCEPAGPLRKVARIWFADSAASIRQSRKSCASRFGISLRVDTWKFESLTAGSADKRPCEARTTTPGSVA